MKSKNKKPTTLERLIGTLTLAGLVAAHARPVGLFLRASADELRNPTTLDGVLAIYGAVACCLAAGCAIVLGCFVAAWAVVRVLERAAVIFVWCLWAVTDGAVERPGGGEEETVGNGEVEVKEEDWPGLEDEP